MREFKMEKINERPLIWNCFWETLETYLKCVWGLEEKFKLELYILILWFMNIIIQYLTIEFRIYREKHFITEGNILEIFERWWECHNALKEEEEENGSRRKWSGMKCQCSKSLVVKSEWQAVNAEWRLDQDH